MGIWGRWEVLGCIGIIPLRGDEDEVGGRNVIEFYQNLLPSQHVAFVRQRRIEGETGRQRKRKKRR